MKKYAYLIALLLFSSGIGFGQFQTGTTVKMQTEYGLKNPDVMNLLYFEDIGLTKVKFSGENLTGRDYQIVVRRFDRGKLTKTETAFDSKTEGEYFRVKDNELSFRVLSKITSENKAKFQFQFNGFSVMREYPIDRRRKDFALKDFMGGRKEADLPLKENTYFLTYMLPYQKADGSKQYCEVVQSGVKPEELGAKYDIPTYFLIGIKFE